ncbi:MAG: FecR domain-containing protein [Betaproteobacteria bacterium]|nr:FecR domain-containing protein [Betaproteobacteria bacterium]
MNRVLAILGAALLALAAAPLEAAPAALVEGVQMPAWVERAGIGAARRLPLAPGMELRGGDELRTGAGARVYVKLAEGSLIKLGENASLRILDLAPDRGGFFKAALNVLEGAFRFTTDLLAKQRRRDVSIRVASVTAGIRGTDLWGKSAPQKQVVCLIDGKIEVGAEGEAPVVMDQPRQFYQRVKGETQPVGFVDPTQLAQWARETEIEDGRGAARSGGRWKVTLARAATQGAALEVYDRLRDAGYAAEILPVKADAGHDYLVRISRLSTRADAEALAEQLRATAGVQEPKVSN